MEKKLTPELKSLKEEFDFLHKMIGELQWKRSMIYYGRKAVSRTEMETLEERLENYFANMRILLEKIENEVRETNKFT